MAESTLRVVIADDEPITRMDLKEILVLDTAGVSSMYANDGGVIVVV